MISEDAPAKWSPNYRCYKEVWADKVVGERSSPPDRDTEIIQNYSGVDWCLETIGWIQVSNELKHRGGPSPVGGYYVRYKDGFESWSPAKAFEEGYTRID
jgi:hypothetical protein